MNETRINTKKCTKCGKIKPLLEFGKETKTLDGLKCWCISCSKIYIKLWYKNNKEKVKVYIKKYHQDNNEKIKAYRKKYYQENKEKIKTQSKKYRKDHPEAENRYYKTNKERIRFNERIRYKKRKEDPKIRLDHSMTIAINRALRGRKAGRQWEKLIGYTIDDLASHIEKQFNDDMTWNNYGSYWHLDHIKPKSWFDYKNPEDKTFKECWSLNNLQPLEASKNLSKHNYYEG